jgi:two-component system cell cycle sensor histidine kinase/response regulator CckA
LTPDETTSQPVHDGASFPFGDADRRILDAMSDGVIVIDGAGVVRYANRGFAELFGHREQELLGKELDAWWFPEDAEVERNRIKAIAGGSATVPFIARRRKQDGAELWSSIRATPMHEQGTFVGLLFMASDHTHAQKLEAKLQQAQKLESLGMLAGGIAHDFNNLLVAVLGHADLALGELPPETPVREQLENIKQAAVRASDLTKQLLAYAGKGRFVIGRLDLNRLLEDTSHLLDAIPSPTVTIKRRLAKELPSIEGDPSQLRQVVVNLVTNAAEALEGTTSGLITIATSLVEVDATYLAETYVSEVLPAGKYVSLEVSDNGEGMTPETRAKIFDPFFSTKFTGRGLGLAAVMGILRSHRAAIKVYSEPGGGSTFRLLFPAKADTSSASEKMKAAPAANWQGTGTVMVIDDEQAVRNVMRRILERAGFRVILKEDGASGVEAYRQQQDEILVIILDVTMPHMGGEETFRRLRQINPDVKVIVSSGYTEREATGLFAGKRIAGFVEKPFTPARLIEQVRATLEPKK